MVSCDFLISPLDMILPNASGCNFFSGYNFVACQSFVNLQCVKLAPQGLFPDQSACKSHQKYIFERQACAAGGLSSSKCIQNTQNLTFSQIFNVRNRRSSSRGFDQVSDGSLWLDFSALTGWSKFGLGASYKTLGRTA